MVDGVARIILLPHPCGKISKLWITANLKKFVFSRPRLIFLADHLHVQVRGQHYDLVVNGMEVGGGSVRVHDATMQEFIFSKILCVCLPFQSVTR
jgi:aspartyl-tRNA synthetase